MVESIGSRVILPGIACLLCVTLGKLLFLRLRFFIFKRVMTIVATSQGCKDELN